MARPHDLLAQIRSLELQLAQQLDDAREAAADELEHARIAGQELVTSAAQRGAHRADQLRRDRLVEAALEAERTRQSGDDAAAEMLATLRVQFDGLVDEFVDVVLTTSDGGE